MSNSESRDKICKNTTSSQRNSHRPQYLACGILSIGGFLGGTTNGWSSTALPSLQLSGDFKGDLTTTTLSWVASIVMLGALAGSIIGGYMIRKLGRKRTLIFSAVPFTIGWIALSFPLNIWMLYTGRFLTGVGMGSKSLAGSVYLSEIAEPEIRGRLSVIWFVAIRLGVLFEFGVGSFLPYNQLAMISSILSVVFGVSLCFLPESPRWLMTEGRRENAMASMCWLRACEKSSPTVKILGEIDEIQKALLRTEKEDKESLSRATSIISKYFPNGVVLKSILIASILMLTRQACGGTIYSFYTVQIFDRTGSALDSHVSGVLIAVAQLVGIALTTFYVDKIGRRIILIASFIIMSLSLISLGSFYQFKTELGDLTEHSGWIPLIMYVVYEVAYAGGPFVLCFAVTSEVIPTKVIGSISGLVTSFGWTFSFLLTRYYEDMNNGMGLANTFWLFAGLSAASALLVHLIVPETVGKTLETIHQHQSRVHHAAKDGIHDGNDNKSQA